MMMENNRNPVCLDALCAALAQVMGIDTPKEAAPADQRLLDFVQDKLKGQKVERIILYNPDAISQWVAQKYPQLLEGVRDNTALSLPYHTVMPSVTPVCFGTLYTGAQPRVHGIEKYEKPVIRIDTLFDALIRAGKKPVIIADTQCSMGKIFLERPMDYFHYDTCAQINAKAAEVILSGEYDFIAIYNGNYDSRVHKKGCESVEALGALHANSEAFATLSQLVRTRGGDKNTLMGFAMDHGSHDLDAPRPGSMGGHGTDMPEDLNIVHHYQVYPAQKS